MTALISGTTEAQGPSPAIAKGARRRFAWRRLFAAVSLLFLLLVIAAAAYGYRPDVSGATLEKRYATSHSEFTTVQGMRVHYVDQGQGSPLVLVHGSNSSLYDWEGWIDALSRHHRVVAMDLPGHGLTGPDPKERYRYVDQARFVAAFTRKLGIRHFNVAGNSMGGSVAWHLALLHPQRVDRLILLDSIGLPREEPRPLMFRAFEWPVIDRLLTVFTPDSSVRMALRDIYGDPGLVTEDQVERTWMLTRREGNRDAARVRLQQQGDSDVYASRLDEIDQPTLIQWGAEDDWVLPKYGQRMDDLIPNSQLVIYPGLGHLPMTEAPLVTARDAAAFLASSGG
ncbi:MAG TPA: alpha/beta hydrolase [Nocardioidaceae bacterium]|nr:alpha/beta hydrolase [Nocardioidaceae bacterium]